MIIIQSRILFILMCSFFISVSCYASEKYVVNNELKNRIEESSYKLSFKQSDGKKIVAYIFAEDEKTIPFVEEGKKESFYTKGHYYLYLYDVSSSSFLPNRIELFKDYDGMNMHITGSEYFVFPKTNKNQPNVILISQQVTADLYQYNAYGISDGGRVKRYMFLGKKKDISFDGQIHPNLEPDGTIVGYTVRNYKIYQYKFSLGKEEGQIKLTPYNTSASSK